MTRPPTRSSRRPRRQTRHGRLSALLLAFALVLAACGDTDDPADEPDVEDADVEEPADTEATDEPGDEPDDAAAEPPDRVERVRLAGNDWGFTSPFAYQRGPGFIFASFAFDTLLWRDATGEPIPWLAEDWSMSDDGLEYTFTLHPEARWHDGEPVTADDVVFTYEYVTEGAGSTAPVFHIRGIQGIEEVLAVSDREVVFRLERPSATFLDRIALSLLIVPERHWRDVDDPGGNRDATALIGSGPYQLESYDDTTGAYRFVADDDFHLGVPVIAALEFVPVDDELRALEAGVLDAAEVFDDAVPDAQLEALEASFDRIDGFGDWNLVLHHNHLAGFPYDELRFRQAVAHAIDRDDLVERILFGRGEPGSLGHLAPSHPMTPYDLPSVDHDPAQAQVLLDELGLVDESGDGWRQLPDGEAFQPTLLTRSGLAPAAGDLVSEALIAIGIDVQVVSQDRASADEAIAEANYELAFVDYGGILNDPDLLRLRFHSQFGADQPPHGYATADLDELLEAQLVEIDPAARAELVAEAQRILATDLPALPLYVPTITAFADGEVFGAWAPTPGCSACRNTRNKHMYVTGQAVGFPEGTP